MKPLFALEDLDLGKTILSILGNVYEAIIITDTESRIIYANPSYTRIMGIPVEKILGKKMCDLEPNSRSLSVFTTQRPIENCFEVIESVGKKVHYHSSPIFHKGSFIGVANTFSDPTELLKMYLVDENSFGTRNRRKILKDALPETFKEIIGNSPKLVSVLKLAAKVARTNSTILIQGESGVGKELIAQAIHNTSPRAKKPFVSINCAAIPETLFESELFGYEPGAFTGANTKGKKGKFQMADGGALMLDEVGELPLSMQAKLLRVLQDKKVDPVGGINPTKVDVRIIAATNDDLFELVEQGRFRRDLFYRLNVIPLLVPPLRERPEDIPLLINHMLRMFCTEENGLPDISFEVMSFFFKYSWKGNVRELENVIGHACIVRTGQEITLQDLPTYLTKTAKNIKTGVSHKIKPIESKISEKEAILKALESNNNNRSKAMKFLGMSRRTFYKKMKLHSINI